MNVLFQNMIDAKAINGRAPTPYLPTAIPNTPKIDEVSLLMKGLKEIGNNRSTYPMV
jgi:hypothetical protein